jgi:hypothetical protein
MPSGRRLRADEDDAHRPVEGAKADHERLIVVDKAKVARSNRGGSVKLFMELVHERVRGAKPGVAGSSEHRLRMRSTSCGTTAAPRTPSLLPGESQKANAELAVGLAEREDVTDRPRAPASRAGGRSRRRPGRHWRDAVTQGDIILVCDVGGGTADFSLVAATDVAGNLELERISVGEHPARRRQRGSGAGLHAALLGNLIR